jgi:hypothetical protein
MAKPHMPAYRTDVPSTMLKTRSCTPHNKHQRKSAQRRKASVNVTERAGFASN